MIPQSTTLQERLEFYEWALGELEIKSNFICWLGDRYYDTDRFRVRHIKELFPELYELRQSNILTLWSGKNQRIEALQKAIIEVKRKIEEGGTN